MEIHQGRKRIMTWLLVSLLVMHTYLYFISPAQGLRGILRLTLVLLMDV